MDNFINPSAALEHFETPRWAAEAILRHEILTKNVIDPCCGAGVLTNAAIKSGYDVYPMDIYDWGFNQQERTSDFLKLTREELPFDPERNDFTVFMNPPFTKAEWFVLHAARLGARKIVCFQRLAWWESQKRREFWRVNPPTRVYICGDRSTCWRHDIPNDKRKESTPTAHAWFVWEPSHPFGTTLGHVWKEVEPKAKTK